MKNISIQYEVFYEYIKEKKLKVVTLELKCKKIENITNNIQIKVSKLKPDFSIGADVAIYFTKVKNIIITNVVQEDSISCITINGVSIDNIPT